jgi:hypothetical protein
LNLSVPSEKNIYFLFSIHFHLYETQERSGPVVKVVWHEVLFDNGMRYIWV